MKPPTAALIFVVLATQSQNTNAKNTIVARNYIYQYSNVSYLINPTFIRVKKRINLNNIKHILSMMSTTEKTYATYCDRYKQEFIAKTVGNWVVVSKLFQNRYKAHWFCKKTYISSLIEIR